MKLITIVLFAIGFSLVASDEQCDKCLEAADDLRRYLDSDEVLKSNYEVILAKVCNVEDHPCKDFMKKHFEELASRIVRIPFLKKIVCVKASYCSDKPTFSLEERWSNRFSCPEAMTFMDKLIELLHDRIFVWRMRSYLLGTYCMDWGWQETDYCSGFVMNYFKIFIATVAELIVRNKSHLASIMAGEQC